MASLKLVHLNYLEERSSIGRIRRVILCSQDFFTSLTSLSIKINFDYKWLCRYMKVDEEEIKR
jgi:hypothetical protein